MTNTSESATELLAKYEKIAQNTKRHHWVPEFYLKYFVAVESCDQVYMYQSGGEPQLVSVSNIAAKKDLYTFTENNGGRKIRVMEGVFSEHEGIVANLLGRIIEERRLPEDEKGRSEVASFVSTLRVRGPSFGEWLRNFEIEHLKLFQQLQAEHSSSLRKDFEEVGVTFDSDEEFETIRDLMRDPESYEIKMKGGEGYYFKQAMELSKEFYSVLMTQKSWHLLVAPEGRNFITSDNPVVIQEPEDCPPHLAGGFQNGTVLLTISPKLCLAFRRVPLKEKNIQLNREDVNNINRSIARVARRQLYSNLDSKDIALLCNELLAGDESQVSIKQMTKFSPYYVSQGVPQYKETGSLKRNSVR